MRVRKEFLEYIEQLKKKHRTQQIQYMKKDRFYDEMLSYTSDPSFAKFTDTQKMDYFLNGMEDRFCPNCNEVRLNRPKSKYCPYKCNGDANKELLSDLKKDPERQKRWRENTKKTLMERYGVDHISKVPEIVERLTRKRRKTIEQQRIDSSMRGV